MNAIPTPFPTAAYQQQARYSSPPSSPRNVPSQPTAFNPPPIPNPSLDAKLSSKPLPPPPPPPPSRAPMTKPQQPQPQPQPQPNERSTPSQLSSTLMNELMYLQQLQKCCLDLITAMVTSPPSETNNLQSSIDQLEKYQQLQETKLNLISGNLVSTNYPISTQFQQLQYLHKIQQLQLAILKSSGQSDCVELGAQQSSSVNPSPDLPNSIPNSVPNPVPHVNPSSNTTPVTSNSNHPGNPYANCYANTNNPSAGLSQVTSKSPPPFSLFRDIVYVESMHCEDYVDVMSQYSTFLGLAENADDELSKELFRNKVLTDNEGRIVLNSEFKPYVERFQQAVDELNKAMKFIKVKPYQIVSVRNTIR